MTSSPATVTTAPAPHYRETEGGVIVYDAALAATVDSQFFDPEHWRAAGAISDTRRGRAEVHLLQHGDARWVLRHYRRGGLIGRFIHDRYLWLGLARTRPWREWHLLAKLHAQGFPVPRPVAAQVQRHGLAYSADLMTELIPDIEPLADVLMRTALPAATWSALGAAIARFHRAGIHHSDLNARNILWRAPQTYFLLDFDGAREHAGPALLESGIRRFRRSLDKFARTAAQFHFDESAWQTLLAAYRHEMKA